jgi:hypothetical protein
MQFLQLAQVSRLFQLGQSPLFQLFDFFDQIHHSAPMPIGAESEIGRMQRFIRFRLRLTILKYKNRGKKSRPARQRLNSFRLLDFRHLDQLGKSRCVVNRQFESILRLISIPAAVNPCISWLYETPSALAAALMRAIHSRRKLRLRTRRSR